MRSNRKAHEIRFLEATFYSAFGIDLPFNWEGLPTRQRMFAARIETASRKLTIKELRALTCVADGVDDDGSSLRPEREA